MGINEPVTAALRVGFAGLCRAMLATVSPIVESATLIDQPIAG